MFDTFCIAHHRKEAVVSKLLSNISFLINILNLHSATTYHEKENGVLSETRGHRSLMSFAIFRNIEEIQKIFIRGSMLG